MIRVLLLVTILLAILGTYTASDAEATPSGTEVRAILLAAEAACIRVDIMDYWPEMSMWDAAKAAHRTVRCHDPVWWEWFESRYPDVPWEHGYRA